MYARWLFVYFLCFYYYTFWCLKFSFAYLLKEASQVWVFLCVCCILSCDLFLYCLKIEGDEVMRKWIYWSENVYWNSGGFHERVEWVFGFYLSNTECFKVLLNALWSWGLVCLRFMSLFEIFFELWLFISNEKGVNIMKITVSYADEKSL